MQRYIQHEFLKVSHFTTREWPHPVHNHNHFEIVFIHRGKGVHSLSGMRYPYDGPTLFLLAPCDFHYFEIREKTEFTFLKFTNVYLSGVGDARMQQGWNQEMDHLLVQMRRRHDPLTTTEKDTLKMDRLIRLITEEWNENPKETSETIFFLIQALLSLIRRNLAPTLAAGPNPNTEKITHLLHYLHQNIYSAEHTSLEHLADVFSYSKNYLGILFKQQTGATLRDYTSQYKFHLAENRLQYSSLSIKEITQELGFTDLSHFSKFFRAHKGMSPSAFREKLAAPTSPGPER